MNMKFLIVLLLVGVLIFGCIQPTDKAPTGEKTDGSAKTANKTSDGTGVKKDEVKPVVTDKTNGETVAPKPEPKTEAVSIKGFAFNPAEITINAGDSVKWTNDDAAPHNIKIGEFISPTMGTGESFEYKFDTAGTYEYICNVHPSMKGAVVVE